MNTQALINRVRGLRLSPIQLGPVVRVMIFVQLFWLFYAEGDHWASMADDDVVAGLFFVFAALGLCGLLLVPQQAQPAVPEAYAREMRAAAWWLEAAKALGWVLLCALSGWLLFVLAFAIYLAWRYGEQKFMDWRWRRNARVLAHGNAEQPERGGLLDGVVRVVFGWLLWPPRMLLRGWPLFLRAVGDMLLLLVLWNAAYLVAILVGE